MKLGSTSYYFFCAALALFLSIGFVFFQIHNAGSQTDNSNALSLSLTDRMTATLESRFAAQPNDVQFGIGLSDAYLQKVRETGDATYYAKIEDTLHALEASHPNEPQIHAERAQIANGRHNFALGLSEIEKAIQGDPNVANFYGIKSDSEIELGAYMDAEKSLQRMLDRKPNFSSFSRAAYQRELHGEQIGAEEALRFAIQAGSISSENIAWAHVELGKLLIRNDVPGAEREFNNALSILPDYAPALEGLGRVAFAKKDLSGAEVLFKKAMDTLPLAQYAIGLGDFYSATKNTAKSAQYYALADVAYKKSESSGVSVDLEYGLFLADHGDVSEALQRTENAYKNRPSIYAADAYAWAQYKNNHMEEARSLLKQSMRLGENDPLLTYHGAMIYVANNDSVSATRLFQKTFDLNPRFSIYFDSSLREHMK